MSHLEVGMQTVSHAQGEQDPRQGKQITDSIRPWQGDHVELCTACLSVVTEEPERVTLTERC